MGLDMNLYKRKLTSDNWKQVMDGGNKEKVKRTFEETDMLYLRKANQIHNYIVEHYADGVDECQEIDIPIEGIKELNELCKKILKKSKLVPAILHGGWGFMNHKPGDIVEVYKINGLEFEPSMKKQASELKVGDIVAGDKITMDDGKRQITSIEERDGGLSMRYDCLYVGKKIEDATLAQDELPTQAGFFFGSTDYDEWYLEDLKEFVRQADEIIEDYDAEIATGVSAYDINYYYRASW